MSFESTRDVKVGVATPREDLLGIRHQTPDGLDVLIDDFQVDAEDPAAVNAKITITDPKSGEASTLTGKIREGIREASHYVVERSDATIEFAKNHPRSTVAGAASLAISVALGSLWAWHRHQD